MGDNKLFDFKSFVSANAERHVSSLDYLHTVYKAHELSVDFILYFTKLFWPDFKVVDGLVYLSDLFESKRYQNLLADGKKSIEAQFWLNLIEITGLFDGLSTDDAIFIAESLAASWNSKMTSEFGTLLTPARAIHDGGTGEVFVTIGAVD